MYNENGQLRNLSSRETGLYFIAGLLFNAVGNGLTVATNMGSAPWTASAANLANATGPINQCVFVCIRTYRRDSQLRSFEEY